MPIAEFPGERNWGYDNVYPFAVESAYGGPRGLQRLVDDCHQAGLAVILDVVYNHFGPEGCYVREFGPYFTDRYKTPWGDAINYDGPQSYGVRNVIVQNVRQWIRDFHVDGLRLDAVHAIYDLGAHHILSEIKEVAETEARQARKPVHIIAESDLNDPRLLDPPASGGHGLDAQWSDDFHHAVHALLTGEQHGYYGDYGRPEHLAKALNDAFVYDGCFSEFRGRFHGACARHHSGERFVISIQNHDQVGNRASGDRLCELLSPPQRRLSAALLLLAPHIPLIFMGEEYGEQQPFPFFCSFRDEALVEAVQKGRREEFAAFRWQGDVPDPQSEETFRSAKLTWTWNERPRATLRRWYQELLHRRTFWPALRDFSHRSAELIHGMPNSVLRLVRGTMPETDEDTIVAYFNLSGEGVSLPAEFSSLALLLSSEFPEFGGIRYADLDTRRLLPFEVQVYGRPEMRNGRA